MLFLSLLVVYLGISSLSLQVLAFFLYCQDRHYAELEIAAKVTFSVGTISLVFASLLWMENSKTTRTVFPAQEHAYAQTNR